MMAQRMPPPALLPKTPEGMIIMPHNRVAFAHPGTGGIIVPMIAATPQLSAASKVKMQKPLPNHVMVQAIKPLQVASTMSGTAAVATTSFDAKSLNSPPTISSLLGLQPDDLSLGAESATMKDVTLGNSGPPSFVGGCYFMASNIIFISDSYYDLITALLIYSSSAVVIMIYSLSGKLDYRLK